ncbi:tetratricopeptide repeat protein [Dysgonomonas sp. GY617]|uniref:tetratricopeptide repeat protein n=1 Tax=Dysgonomonas sp. GY617 TaxID=2780420 RepID=UPI0018845C14|nr:tetratricopeptide repeat protein [Dysgonomonas sp. GY617]MBF0574786.1 tetratricopeptide repeat protein [Dysgonomonas sp. GY617]
MKITLIKYLFCLFIGTSLFSCQKDKSQELIREAQNSLMMGQPDVALNLLASIQNLESLDEYNYMKYVVTHIGAKYEAKEDIKADTLILKAQKYFSEKGNAHDQILANLYAAQFYSMNDDYPKALEYYMYTTYQADKSNNHLAAGTSFNNIGYIYYDQDLFDKAIINYRKALIYYDKVKNTDHKKIKTCTNLGQSFEEINQLDSACFYYNKALDKAIEINNEAYQSFSLQNLGVVSYTMGEYDKTVKYFQSALAMDVTNNIQTRQMYLFLLNTYNKKQDSDSAKRYANLVIKNLPEVTFIYTIKGMYTALSEYYKQSGDFQQALQYNDLEKKTIEQIEKEKKVSKLLAIDKEIYVAKKDEEINQLLKYKQYTRYIEELF